MKPFQSSIGTILQINFKLLGAFCFLLVSYLIWPDTMLGYGWGFISICLSLSAVGLLIEAAKEMFKLYARDKTMKEYMAQGNKPKSSNLADVHKLDEAGMR